MKPVFLLADSQKDSGSAPEASGALAGDLAPYADILQTIADAHGVPALHILGRGRRRDVTAARRAFMIALRDNEDLTLQQIADLTGRTHTTVLDYVSPARREQARTYKSRRRREDRVTLRHVATALRVI